MEELARKNVQSSLTCVASLKPHHYKLRIEPDLEKACFEGAITIDMDVLETSFSITVNVHNLIIHSTILYDDEGAPIPLASARADPATQTFIITPAVALTPDTQVFLYQTFSGTIGQDESCKGFFLSPRSPTNSTSNPLSSTNLEPTYARSVFPCFDDPSLKATFALTLVISAQLTALSNTPVKSMRAKRVVSSLIPLKKIIEFETTPHLPTYLLAFVIGTMNYIENTELRIPLRAYATTEHQIENCHSALNFAARALSILEKDFGINCGLKKLDIIAVPGSTGCMANWGLITVYPTALVTSVHHGAKDKLISMGLIAHEIAQQYFGNLVTMQSWDCFWLKNGLAEWTEAYIRSRLGNVETGAEGVSESLQRAFKSDESRFGHALEMTVDNEDGNFREMYDDITCKKGHAIIRMLENQLGRDVFILGLKTFLNENLYETVTPDGLWRIFDAISGVNVSVMMRIWTQTAGYPILEVQENKAVGTITIIQKRFFKDGRDEMDSFEMVFPMRISIQTRIGVWKGILHNKQTHLKMSTNCFKFNAGQSGYYRVEYSPARLAALGADLCGGMMSVEDKIGVVSDATALCFTSRSPIRTSNLLSLLQNFEAENSYFVWKTIISALRRISSTLVFEDRALQDAFYQYWRHLVSRCLYRNASFSVYDNLNEQMFKALMFGNSGGDERVTKAAEAMFESWSGVENKSINPNIRAEIFELVLKNGGKKEYRKLIHCLNNAKDPVRRDILASLGHTRHYGCLKETLNRATSVNCLSNSETAIMLQPMTMHKKGILVLWRYISTGTWMKNPHMSLIRVMPIVKMWLNSLTSMEQCESVRKQMSSHDTSTFDKEIARCFEDIEVRARWLERDRKDIMQWLKRNGYIKLPPSKVELGMKGARKLAHLVGFA